MEKPVVGILMGSLSDAEIMRECGRVLKKFDIPFEVDVSSAHRTPEKTARYAESARERGLRVIIVGAGAAAHLAGVVAAHTTLPVIGIPIDSSPLNGMDALLATVQMPSGIPVGTMAVGKAGAKNAAYYALQILGTADAGVAEKLTRYKQEMTEMIAEQSQKVQDLLG